MATRFQVTFDAADPRQLGSFWCAALGYVEQPPPDGFETWDAALESWGVPPAQRDAAYAIVDPDDAGPRIYLQKVPEAKTAKNRVHLDVNVGEGLDGDERTAAVRDEAERLVALGASVLREIEENGEFWIVMHDPEGNEFDLQ